MRDLVGHDVAKQHRSVLFIIAMLLRYPLVENIAVAADAFRRHIRNAERRFAQTRVRQHDPQLKIGGENRLFGRLPRPANLDVPPGN